MSVKEQIKQYFQDHKEELTKEVVELTSRMVKEKTVNVVSAKLSEHPYLEFRGEEYRCGKIVKEYLDNAGIPYEEYARMEGRPNIIGTLGKNENGKRLLMPGHMDIVPAGEGW